MKKIILATGIFYPDVGGPSIHVQQIADYLTDKGYQVVVVHYGERTSFSYQTIAVSRKLPKLIAWGLYFLQIVRCGWNANLIYAFDISAAGLPARVASLLMRKPFIVRVGGDPIWERVVEKGKRLMPLKEYYEKGLHKKDKPLLASIISFVLRGANSVVFYNTMWREFFDTYFGVSEERSVIIKNPAFRREQVVVKGDPQIIFAGRFVAYKNLSRVIRVFQEVRRETGKGKLLLVGHGPDKDMLITQIGEDEHVTIIDSLPQDKLFEKIKESAIAIGPALSEFNPNFILESLSFGKPVLLSRGHGLSVELPEEFLFDPTNEKELKAKLLYLFEEEHYTKAVEMVADLDMSQTWEKVLEAHKALIERMI